MIDVFIAYAHEDLAFKNELKKFLAPLLREGRVTVWDDFDINAGEDWDAAIKQRLYSAGVVLLLVSADSLASKYFYGEEVRISLERHQRGDMVLVPIVLRSCDWTSTPLGALEALPAKGKAVSSWPNRDDAFQDIVTGLRAVINRVEQHRMQKAGETEKRRQFEAACLAADQLFHNKRWTEAKTAYQQAQKNYANGAVPTFADLNARIADCDRQAKKASEEQKERERQQRITEEQARKETEQQRRAQKPTSYEPAPEWRISRLYVLLGAALLLAGVGYALWSKNGNQITPTNTPTNATKLSFPDFVLIKGGTYTMGDQFSEGSSDEKPHTVTVSDFYLSKYEVTFREYDAFCAATGRDKPSDAGWGRGERPAINVSWYDAIEYCNWLSQQQGRKPYYTIDKSNKDPNNGNGNDGQKWTITRNTAANGYRLPTEAEWEYAAREGGKKVRFGNGSDIIKPSEVNFDASESYKKNYSVAGEYRQKTVLVQELKSNALGLYHMSGNVWEWCWDWYGDNYTQNEGARNPLGATSGSNRVLRGGSWDYYPQICRAAFRYYYWPAYRFNNIGFRLACAPQ
jgi:formylglycine-generating enzyme required for sulfatase activity